MMKAILVPVDGSDCSTRALKFAIEVAKGRDDVALHVLTVQAPIISGNVKRFVSTEAINSYYQEEGEKALKPARSLLDEAGISCKGIIEVGPAARTIAEFVKKHDCDVIVMGTRGLGAVANLVLGSITTKVLHLVDVPVTLVK
jgi:Universal stress protein UspA and related nucleotide-binding proteins